MFSYFLFDDDAVKPSLSAFGCESEWSERLPWLLAQCPFGARSHTHHKCLFFRLPLAFMKHAITPDLRSLSGRCTARCYLPPPDNDGDRRGAPFLLPLRCRLLPCARGHARQRAAEPPLHRHRPAPPHQPSRRAAELPSRAATSPRC